MFLVFHSLLKRRLCRCQSKAPLHRYCRPPEFHQFPRVKITSFQELFISLHSLPRSDISKDLPTYAWVLADPRTGTPKRTSKDNEVSSGKKLAYPTPSKACFEREIGRDSVGTNAVRKLKFPEPSYCKKAGLRSSVASTRTDQAKLNPISKPGLGTTSSLTTAQPTSVVSLDCLEGDGNKNYGSLLPRQDVEFSEHDNGESFGEMLATAVVGCAALDETVKNGNSRSCRPLSTRKSVDFNKGEVDVGLSQSDTRTDNSRSNEKYYNEAHNTSISASDDIECGKNGRVSKPLTLRTTKKLILSSDRCKHNDRANFRTFSAQKVTGSVCYKCESQLGLSNSNTTENNFHGNSMSFIDNNCASYGIFSQTQSNNLSNLPHGLKEYSKLRPDRSSLEQNEFCLLDERRTSKLAGSRADELQGNLSEDWPVTKKDPVLPGVRKGIEEVLPGMRHVIEKEYKRKINEKLWNCLSPESPYSGGDQRTTSEFTETKERVRTKKVCWRSLTDKALRSV